MFIHFKVTGVRKSEDLNFLPLFLVAPFLENGATYLLSTVSVGLYVCMYVCLCVCGQLESFGIIFSLFP